MTSSSRSTSSSMTNPLATTSSSKGGSRRRKSGMNMSRSRARSASMALAGGKRRRRRGGASSAWQNGVNVIGAGDTAYNRVFSNNGGPTPYGNAIVGTSGQNSVIPPSVASSGAIKGGKKRTKRGGYWGQVINNALVPFGLWAAQNKYSKRKGLTGLIPKFGGKTRKHRKH